MINVYDIAYGLGVGLAAPYWLLKPSARRKVLKAFRQRMGNVPSRDVSRPAVMIHAVSLGEMNATRALVQGLLAARPDLQFIISTTTETGYAAGQKAYGQAPGVTLIRYPLDFSPVVSQVLDAMRPSVVVLMELEVWPNFLRLCQRRRIPVVLGNGRITATSYRNYRYGHLLTRGMFGGLAAVCAQEPLYAQRFVDLGTPASRVQVTGTMKFDTAQVAPHIAGDKELAAAVGLRPLHERIWVCGSTGPGEEAILLDCFRTLRKAFPDLRLVLVPRDNKRFDEVAQLITAHRFRLVRRSWSVTGGTGTPSDPGPVSTVPPVVLGDTMGELRLFYSLAELVFVGRSLLDLGSRQHGSDMIEPAALAKPVIVGPFTGNFAEVMNCFRAAQAIRQVHGPAELVQAAEQCLSDPAVAAALGRTAQDVVLHQQGATARHVQVILTQLTAAAPLQAQRA